MGVFGSLFGWNTEKPVEKQRDTGSSSRFREIQAGTTFDAAQTNDDNFRNWGHVKPETPEEIIDPLALERLRTRAMYECLNDDALNGMINISAESVVHRGPRLQIQIERRGQRDKNLERLVERAWADWAVETKYFRKMRTAAKDLRNYGQFFRRLVYNPRISNCLDVIYHNPTRVANPDGFENGESVFIGPDRYRVVNGVAYDNFGNETYYCVLDRPIYPGPYESWSYEWVSYEVMARCFDPQMSEQPDGFPWATPSLEKGAFRRSYEKSETKAASLAASMFGQVVTKNEFIPFFADSMNAPDDLPGLEAMRHYSPGRKVGIDNGSFPIMTPGTAIETFETQHPHTDFETFTRTLQRGQGLPLRLPGNMASLSSDNASYASAMKDEQRWDWHREIEQYDVEIIDLIPVVRKFAAIQSTFSPELKALATGEAKITNIALYWRACDHADPLKYVTALAVGLHEGIYSYKEVWAKRQQDPESFPDEILEGFEMMKPLLQAKKEAKLQSRARSKNVERPE